MKLDDLTAVGEKDIEVINDKLNNINDGIKMLARHIKNNDKIFI